ncbi:MAG: TULIP family P47-like protein [Boseongicola sp.]|nr:MAG: TULIP family P47-like protein [Boseongicola sp.]
MNMHLTEATTLGSPPMEFGDLLEGWDTVFGIRYANVNSSIVASGASPDDFSESATDTDGDVATITGPFGDWQLTGGGAGRLIMMEIPVPTVTLTRTGKTDQTRTNVVYTVKVALEPVPVGSGDQGGELFAFRLIAPKDSFLSDGVPLITVESVEYDGSETDTPTNFYLRGLMETWLNKNAQEFDHVFATVNLNSKADKEHFQWLRPTDTSYAVYDDGTVENGVFGVLCMTEGRESAHRAQMISPDTLTAGKTGSFLISKERFLRKMILYSMKDLFTGPVKEDRSKVWPDDYFDLADLDNTVTNTADLYIEEMILEEGKDGVRVEVPANTLVARLGDSYLDVSFENLWHPYNKWGAWWLVTIHHDIRSRSMAKLVDGKFSLAPEVKPDDPNQTVFHHYATVEKTKAAKVIYYVLLGLAILAVVLPAMKWGYMKWVGTAAEATEGGAAVAGQMVQTTAPTAGDIAAGTAAGAGPAAAVASGETVTMSQWVMAQITARRAVIMGMMSGIGFAYEQFLPIMADKDAQKELPNFREFTTEVMTPVSFPGNTGFEVDQLQFNGSLQALGQAHFTA